MPFTKQILLVGLTSAFFVQTQAVYTDPHKTRQLGKQEQAGRRIWNQNNCQSCHQFHGYGGFLGPDLTNVVEKLARNQLEARLALGEGLMPAFEMDPDEIDAVWAFLGAMNETGTGQARNPNLAGVERYEAASNEPLDIATTPGDALRQVIGEHGDADVADGYTLFRSRSCTECHVLYGRSAVGAPDLSYSGDRLTPDQIMAVLKEGREPAMPAAGLSPDERASLASFIVFMAEHRAVTLARIVDEPESFWVSVPWWEFD